MARFSSIITTLHFLRFFEISLVPQRITKLPKTVLDSVTGSVDVQQKVLEVHNNGSGTCGRGSKLKFLMCLRWNFRVKFFHFPRCSFQNRVVETSERFSKLGVGERWTINRISRQCLSFHWHLTQLASIMNAGSQVTIQENRWINIHLVFNQITKI